MSIFLASQLQEAIGLEVVIRTSGNKDKQGNLRRFEIFLVWRIKIKNMEFCKANLTTATGF